MPVKKSLPGELEPIETASRDELAALQLKRLKWTLSRAYRNVPHYRRMFDAAGVHPKDLESLVDLGKFPFTTKVDLRDNYPFGCSQCHARSGAHPCVVGDHRQTDRRRLHGQRRRHVGDRDGTLDPRAGGRAGDIIHVAYGYGLFTAGSARTTAPKSSAPR